MNRTFRIFTLITFMAAFIYLIILADNGQFPLWIKKLYDYKGGDKLGHLLIMFLLSIVMNIFFNLRRFNFFNQKILLGSFIASIIVTGEEFSQIFFPNRTFDLRDLICSLIGVFFGGYLLRLLSSINKMYLKI